MTTRREPTEQELSMVDMPSQRDADRAQWRRYAEAATGMGEGVWPGGHMPENAEKLAANCVAFANAMLAADKAKWGE